MEKNQEIEALRGMAVLMVIVGHVGNILYWIPDLGESLSAYGLGAGVDLFFIISGFVFTQAFYAPMKASVAQGPAAFGRAIRAFMIRRTFRIMPAALFWLLVVCAASVWFNSTTIFSTLQRNFTDFVAVAFNVSNFYFAKCLAAGAQGWCGHNSVYWSVSVEQQFYLFFPLIVLLPKRVMVAATLVVVLVMANIDRSILTWFTRVDGLMAGVCLAFAFETASMRRLGTLPLDRLPIRIALMGALFAAVVFMPYASTSLPHAYPELANLCCFVMVALAAFGKHFAFGDTLLRRCLAYVGTRSFALYLMHNPAGWFTRELAANFGLLDAKQFPIHPLAFGLCAFLLMFLMAELSLRLVESPWREWGRQIARQPWRSAVTAPEAIRAGIAAAR